jgi:hypothetical protein
MNKEKIRMVVKRIIISLIFILSILIQTSAQNNLSIQIKKLKVGYTDLETIKKLFGEPEKISKGLEYFECINGKEKNYWQSKDGIKCYGLISDN